MSSHHEFIGNHPFTVRSGVETPTAGQTDWNVTYIPDRLMVFLNGVKLISGTDYTATNGTTVVLTSGAGTDDRIEFLCFDLGEADV